MKRFVKPLGLSVAAVLFAVPAAYAGAKSAFPLTINTASRYAYGAMGTVRASADASAVIYCRSEATPTLEGVRCFAVNATVNVSCYSSSPALVRSLQSASDSAYIWFSWDANGTCTGLDILKGSHLEPKQ
jgi:hypothetical protein